MLVKEIVEGLADRSNTAITRKTLATRYKVSTRTISNKLQSLGFKWNRETNKHDYIGEVDINEIYEIDFDSLFDDTATSIEIPVNNKGALQVSNRVKTKKAQSPTSTQDISKFFEDTDDNGRTYKGYYIDNDLVEIMEKVSSGKRSDLVNTCLRKAFEEKGLL